MIDVHFVIITFAPNGDVTEVRIEDFTRGRLPEKPNLPDLVDMGLARGLRFVCQLVVGQAVLPVWECVS